MTSTSKNDFTAMVDSPAEETAAVAFEAIPQLAANVDWLMKMDRLRELKQLEFKLFNSDEKKGPLGEYEALKRECAAIAAVAGASSVAYYDMRLAQVAGGMTKGKVTGEAIINQIVLDTGDALTHEHYQAIAESAKECDPQALLKNGISPLTISRAKTPDKPRAGSIQVSWIGAKGKGANGKRGGGSIQ